MSAIKLSTPSSGSISLSPADTASNLTITVPAVSGTMATSTTPTFTTTIGVGGATPAASGAGITFPSTQSASSDANTLDDYEEGTWTPSLTFGGNSVGMTYQTNGRVGTYTKVGRLVTISIWIQLTNKGTSTGNALITGLPFTTLNLVNAYAGANCSHWNAINTFTFVGSFINPNSTSLELTGGAPPTSTTSAVTDASFQNTSYLIMNMTYSANT